MDQQVFAIVNGDEYHLGMVAEICYPEFGETDQAALAFAHVLRNIVEEMVFGTVGSVDASGDCTKQFTIELR